MNDFRNVALAATFLEFITCGPVSWKVDFTPQRQRELINIVVFARDDKHAINADLTGCDFPDRARALSLDAYPDMAVLDDIGSDLDDILKVREGMLSYSGTHLFSR